MVRTEQLKQYAAQSLAELFATFLMIFIGNLSVAQNKFTPPERQDSTGVHLSYAIGVYVALMVAGPISGAHINPAVSIGLLSLRKLKVIQCLFYIVGQILGAFLACPLIYLVYLGQFNLFDGGIRQMQGPNGTADIFYTVPRAGIENWNCLVDSTVGTMILMIFVMSLGNDYNQLISNAAKPFSFVLMISAFGFAMTINCGNPINPARDFGPRLFAACIYGWKVFRVDDYYFWITLVGPLVGSLMGVWIFEGYLVLMKNYANIPGIAHVEAIEQGDRRSSQEKPNGYHARVAAESKPSA